MQDGAKAISWVAELQPNTGRVHYHLIVFGSRPAWVMNRWGKGRTQVKKCWSIGYMLKYLWKGKGGEGLPKGARRFGIRVKKGLLCRKALYIIGLSKLPAWVAKFCEETTGTLAIKKNGVWFAGNHELENEWRAW